MKAVYALFATSLLLIAACSDKQAPSLESVPPEQSVSKETIDKNSASLNTLLNEMFLEQLARQASEEAHLGLHSQSSQLDDLSEGHAKESLHLRQTQLLALQTRPHGSLDEQTDLSLRLFVKDLKNAIEDYRWRFHQQPLNSINGSHLQALRLLVNAHPINNIDDARAYIHRLKAVPESLNQLKIALTTRADQGLYPPAFVFPIAIGDSEASLGELIKTDFSRKLEESGLSGNLNLALTTSATNTLKTRVLPAYKTFATYLRRLERRAQSKQRYTSEARQIEESQTNYYNLQLKRYTGTDLNADALFKLGQEEVARLQREIDEERAAHSLAVNRSQLFKNLRSQDRFYYADDSAGREAYLLQTQMIIDEIKPLMGSLYSGELTHPIELTQDHSTLSSGKARYASPEHHNGEHASLSLKLSDMNQMPRHRLQALTYHETLPGHHMQWLAANKSALPLFRQFKAQPAFTEGWGAYAEWLPSTLGLYRDPYANIGRLSLELWRAARMVVDSGLHSQKWEREQAIAYLMANTEQTENEATLAVERCLVRPGEAAATSVGLLKIRALHREAKAHLGQQFNLNEFHDAVLRNGPLPLDVLEEQVAAWVAALKQP